MKRTPLKRKTPLGRRPRAKDGLCECGCGGAPRIAPSTWAARGWVKGEPVHFISGHNTPRLGLDSYDEMPGPLSTPCWIHRKVPNSKGYVQVRIAGRLQSAHRTLYECLVGPIADGLQLDHLCRTRNCVNPAHLEPVSCKENIERGWAARAA